MKTLDEALLLLQRIHGVVEQFALAMQRNQPTTAFVMNIRRTLPSLAANLKAQFGIIADQVTAANLAVGRGASEQVRLRGMRESVAQIKQALEIAITHTKDKYSVAIAERADADEG
jgi:hypothetical protein